AVEAAPVAGTKQAQAAAGAEDPPVDARPRPALLPVDRNGRRAETVDDDTHRELARRGALQRLGDRDGAAVEIEDVGLEQHLGARRVDRLDQRREERDAALDQGDPMAAEEGSRGLGTRRRPGHARDQVSSSSAMSGRWSYMRAHAVPRGTDVDTQRKPRM